MRVPRSLSLSVAAAVAVTATTFGSLPAAVAASPSASAVHGSAGAFRAEATTSAADEEAVAEVAGALPAQPGLSGDVRGSITLPDTGAEMHGTFGSASASDVAIAWTSSAPAVVTAADSGESPNIVRKGSVTRGAADQAVTLTATLTLGSARQTVSLPVTVPAAAPVADDDLQAYLFAYFTESSVDGEKIRMSVSEGNDALNWRTLNGGQPVLESTQGDRGLRDPFVLRSKEGDRFFLIATDLSVGRKGWDGATRTGSRYLEIWESTDLVNWGEQRHVEVSAPNAGMTWAPEAHYDPTIDAYVVYWTSTMYTDASRTTEDGYGPQVLMSTTRDFVTFTPAVPWIKAQDIEGLRKQDSGLIDTTVLEDQGTFYRFTKGSEESRCRPDIVAEKSTDLRAPSSSGAWKKFDTCIATDAGLPEVEGPEIFRSNPGDVNGKRFYLFVDNYTSTGYIPMYTDSLDEGQVDWRVPAESALPRSPRHGAVIGITRAERDGLLARWNPEQRVTSVAPVSMQAQPGTSAVTLPATVDATTPGGTIPVGVTWQAQDLSGLRAAGDSVEVRGSLNDGSAVPAIATITAAANPVASTALTLGYGSRVLALGSTAALTATVAPDNADQRVTWSTSNADVASVDASGEVAAHALGAAVITATTADGRTATLTVSVVRPEADLLLHYAFDDAAATTDGARITDTSGHGHDATLHGQGAAAATGARGGAGDGALSFPGGAPGSSAAYASIPAGVLPADTRDVTVSTWVKWDGGVACQWPVTLGATVSNYLFTSPDCGGVAAAIKAGFTENKSGTSSPLPQGTWAQVTLVLTAKSTLVTYVDGRKVSEVATIFDAGDLASWGGVGGLLAKSRYTQDSFFAGDLDDVRVYGRALDATEAATLFTAGTLEGSGTGPTPSPTPTASPTVTPTPTPTATPTPTPTVSPTPTASPTASPTPTATAIPTVAPTPTPSATPAPAPAATPSTSPAETAGTLAATGSGSPWVLTVGAFVLLVVGGVVLIARRRALRR